MIVSACFCMGFCLLTASLFAAPPVDDHTDLTWFRDKSGEKQLILSRDDWELRREEIVLQLERVMGVLPDRSKWPQPDVRILEQTDLPGGIQRQKIEYFTSSSQRRVRAWLCLPGDRRGRLLPEDRQSRQAAILCLHQTTSIGKDEPVGLGGHPNLHYAMELTERGFVTLSPDYPGFGESTSHTKETDLPEVSDTSGSMIAIAENMRAIDILQTLSNVDPEKIGCIGHSLGGHNTMFTAVFDPRIKVLVSSCGFTRFHLDSFPSEGGLGSWAGPTYMPRIASLYHNDPDQMPFDFPEVIAALAPRPFMTCSTVHDQDFDVTGVRDSIAAARPIYSLYSATERLRAEYPDGPHDFPPNARESAYRFLRVHLQPSSEISGESE